VIQRTLGFQARYTNLTDTVRTAWEWMKSHPHGYT